MGGIKGRVIRWQFGPLSINLYRYAVHVDFKLTATGGPDSTTLEGMLSGFAGYGQKHADVIRKWGRFPHR